jgi:hypothetical protein
VLLNKLTLFDSASNDSKCYYNGVEMIFIPAPIANMAYAQENQQYLGIQI